MTPLAPGIHLVHKPAGPSSHAVVESLRSGPRPKLCHGGVLDPFADGLLLVLAGDATRLFPHLHEIPKVYVATLAWGRETDTGDAGGATTAEAAPPPEAAIAAALAAFVGHHEQVPPATSNKRVDGERAYVRVQRGEEVILPPAPVYLHSVRVLSNDGDRTSLVLTCRGGYYVRAFARDLGRALGSAAHIQALHRTAIGPWSDPGETPRRIQGEQLLPWLRSRVVTAAERNSLEVGQVLPAETVRPASWPGPAGFPFAATVRLVSEGRLVGLAEPTPTGLSVTVTLGRGV